MGREHPQTLALTAGVAHELANALQAIAGWAQLARQGVQVDEALEIIEHNAARGAAVARHMLTELRDPNAELGAETVLDVGSVVTDVARLLAPAARQAEVQVHLDVAPGLTVCGPPPDLWTLCWNLGLNAVQALAPQGGQLWLRVFPRAVATSEAEPAVCIEIEDDGPGIDPELRARVLEPFVSTKSDGHGLGLSLVERAVRHLGGELHLESEPGRGTRWRIDLPPHNEPAAATPDAETPSSHGASGFYTRTPSLAARVLVVDDDPGTRGLIATALGMRGAEVVTAAGRSQALNAEGPFDLVIVDLLLADSSGDRLLTELRAHGVVDRALMMTGLDAPPRLCTGGAPHAWLSKPFQLDDLFRQLDALIEPTAEPGAATGVRQETP